MTTSAESERAVEGCRRPAWLRLPPSAGDGAWMTTRALADALDLPESTVRYWRHVGKGPRSIKMGRVVKYRREDVEAWIRAQYDAGRGDVIVDVFDTDGAS